MLPFEQGSNAVHCHGAMMSAFLHAAEHEALALPALLCELSSEPCAVAAQATSAWQLSSLQSRLALCVRDWNQKHAPGCRPDPSLCAHATS